MTASRWRSMGCAVGFPMIALIIAAASPDLIHAADDAKEVRPGGSVVIAREPKTIDQASARYGRVAVLATSEAADARNVLVYVAPDDVVAGGDSVTYSVDGAKRTVTLSIKSGAGGVTDSEFYPTAFKAIFTLLILAVLLESGLALIFHWRPFLVSFDPRATNPLVAFAFAFFFVRWFKLDIATTLVTLYQGDPSRDWAWPGSFITAAIIAGGSAAVNRVFQGLGFRAESSQVQPPQKPSPTQAWVAVSLKREKAIGLVTVLMLNAQLGAPKAIGTILGTGRRVGGFLRFFLRDKERFPQTGGFAIQPGTSFAIQLEDSEGQTSPTWGPYEAAPGSLNDIELTL